MNDKDHVRAIQVFVKQIIVMVITMLILGHSFSASDNLQYTWLLLTAIMTQLSMLKMQLYKFRSTVLIVQKVFKSTDIP